MKTLPLLGRVFELKSYAKLNLSLLVFKPKKNGYHPICSVFQEISLHDSLQIQLIPEKKCSIESTLPHFPTDHTNLLHQVYSKLKNNINYGMKITVTKNIPMGSGLGGGSSNAGTLLTFMTTLFKLNYTPKQHQHIAKSLGADIPFFLNGGTQLIRGIGEKCTPLPTKKRQYYVLIIPKIHTETTTVYTHYDQQPSLPLPIKTPKSILKHYTGPNTLKETLYQLNPTFKTLEMTLRQLNTPPIQLSGTGSTLFFIVTKWSTAIEWKKTLTKVLTNSLTKSGIDCQIHAVKPIQKQPPLALNR